MHLPRRHHGRGHPRRAGDDEAAEPPTEFHTILGVGRQDRGWRVGFKVRANADNGPDATNARQFGAEGIGLCRTEHMFLGEDRLPVVRRDDPGQHARGGDGRARGAAQGPEGRLRRDPRGDGRPAGHGPPARPAAARVPAQRRRARGQEAGLRPHRRGGGPATAPPRRGREFNPMLGTRGVRLGVVKPGSLRHAGAGAHGGRRRPRQGRRQPDRRDHDPAHRHPRGAGRGPRAGWRKRSRRPPRASRRSRRSSSAR